MMANLSERDRRTVTWGLWGVGLIVAVVVVGFPLNDYWEKLVKEEKQTVGRLQTIQNQLSDQLIVRKHLKELNVKATLFSDRIALNQQTALMVRQLQQLRAFSSIDVRRMEGLPLRDEEDFFRSAVSIQFTGSLNKLHQFLQEIEDSEPALKVDRLTISVDAKDESLVDGQMVISGYALVTRKGKS